MTDLTKQLIAIAKELKANFTLHEVPMDVEEVFSCTGLLPAIARRADQLSSLCLGYGIGVTFEDDDAAFLGVKVEFDEVTPAVLRLLTITDAVCELIQTAASQDATPLDELMYD